MSDMSFGTLLLYYALIFAGLLIYMVPTLVAIGRKHSRTKMIALVNIFVGWSVVGWIAAMVWTFSRD